MKVLVVIGLCVLALAFLMAAWHFGSTRGWGRRGSCYWHLWLGLAWLTGYLAVIVALH